MPAAGSHPDLRCCPLNVRSTSTPEVPRGGRHFSANNGSRAKALRIQYINKNPGTLPGVLCQEVAQSGSDSRGLPLPASAKPAHHAEAAGEEG
jgi:hypothetical protein